MSFICTSVLTVRLVLVHKAVYLWLAKIFFLTSLMQNWIRFRFSRPQPGLRVGEHGTKLHRIRSANVASQVCGDCIRQGWSQNLWLRALDHHLVWVVNWRALAVLRSWSSWESLGFEEKAATSCQATRSVFLGLRAIRCQHERRKSTLENAVPLILLLELVVCVWYLARSRV